MWGVGTPNALKTTIITTIMNPIKGNKKDEEKKIINEAAGEEYKYGFVTDVANQRDGSFGLLTCRLVDLLTR